MATSKAPHSRSALATGRTASTAAQGLPGCETPIPDQFVGILDALNDAVVVSDASLRPVFRNAAARAAFSLGAEMPQWFTEAGAAVDATELPHARVTRTGRAVESVLAYGSAFDSARWFRVSARVLCGRVPADRCVVTQFADITELKRSEIRLRSLANIDPLTRLANRRAVQDHIDRVLGTARRRHGRFAVAYLDLDGFKPVNDTFGHEAGDRLLIEVAARIGGELRTADLLGRLGGDEFCIVLADVTTAADVGIVLGRALAAVCRPIAINEMEHVSISASMGVALYPDDAADTADLLRVADKTMYLAKARGKNCIEFYDKEVDREVEELRDLLTAIARGLDDEEFRLWFQPKVNLSTGRVTGVEALVRWQHPQLGLLFPERFLGAIERSDLIVRLGDWVIDEALRCATAWHLMGLDLQVSINVAPRQLTQSDFTDKLEAALARHPVLPPHLLQLELIETGHPGEIDSMRQVLDYCRSMGVRCAIDDFGTGLSSIAHFRYLPADTLKVDQSCVDAMLRNCDDYMMVRGIIAVADAFGMEVVAEGMETAEHGARLYAAGCHVAQGFGIAEPMPEIDVAAWCSRFRPDPRWTEPLAPYCDGAQRVEPPPPARD